MSGSRLILSERLNTLGWPGGLGAALLLLAAAYAAFVVIPADAEFARLQAKVTTAQERLARVEAGTEVLPESPTRQLEQFHQTLPAQAAATQAIDHIYAAAGAESLSLARGEYVLVVDPETQLVRYQIVLPVRGSYPQLRRFLATALEAVPALSLEAVEFQRKQIAETELEGRIRMTLYLSRR